MLREGKKKTKSLRIESKNIRVLDVVIYVLTHELSEACQLQLAAQ